MNALSGKRVLNTRAIEQQEPFDLLLRQARAVPVSFPCIAIEALESNEELDDSLRRAAAGQYAWVLITSANAAAAVGTRLRALGQPVAARIGAVGEATAETVAFWLGREIDVMPSDQTAAALAAALPIRDGDRVLIPGSSRARSDLSRALQARGAVVEMAVAYRTVTTASTSRTARLLSEQAFDAVAFASPSAVEGFAGHLRSAGMTPEELSHVVVGCIGPTTFQTAIEAGFSRAVQANPHSLEGLITALTTELSARRDREARSKP